MSRAGTLGRGGQGWQLILADLALILFLMTLSALPAVEAEAVRDHADHDAPAADRPSIAPTEIAAAQALYRPVAGGPGLATWLAAQPRDPRATLTVFVRHRPGGEAAAWEKAQAMTQDAQASGVAIRTIITAGQENDVYASLAYDAVR
jgi:hypothetical protein